MLVQQTYIVKIVFLAWTYTAVRNDNWPRSTRNGNGTRVGYRRKIVSCKKNLVHHNMQLQFVTLHVPNKYNWNIFLVKLDISQTQTDKNIPVIS